MTTETIPEETQTLDDFVRKNEFPEKYSHLVNLSEFEWIFKNRKDNGFSKAFKMIGRKPYVHIPTFHDCFLNR